MAEDTGKTVGTNVFHLKLRWKLFVVMLGLTLFMGGMSAFIYSFVGQALHEEQVVYGKAVFHALAANSSEPLLTEDIVALHGLLTTSKEKEIDVRYGFVVSPAGSVITHTFADGFPRFLLDVPPPEQGKDISIRNYATDEGAILHLSGDILGGDLGTLHLGFSHHWVDSRLERLRFYFILVTITFLALGSAASLWFSKLVIKPLVHLAGAARKISKGRFDHRLAVTSNDEIGSLAQTFNQMVTELGDLWKERDKVIVELHRAHDELEDRVQERTRELQTVNKELDAFAYSVSHDLRAPLRGIDGFSLALLEDYNDVLDDGGRDYLRRIRAGCVRMGALIDGILKLSRLSRGELHYVQTDLSKIARKICDELQQADSSRQVEFRIPDKVMADGDKTLLEIVLQNLLGNAWKFTAKNKEKARIEFGSEKNDNQTVYFVRDNGVGFDMRYANKLFSAFQRLHANKEFEGTGIGLATVQRIIHRHGGRVWAESEEGKGAVFFFSLGMTEERLKEEVEQ